MYKFAHSLVIYNIMSLTYQQICRKHTHIQRMCLQLAHRCRHLESIMCYYLYYSFFSLTIHQARFEGFAYLHDLHTGTNRMDTNVCSGILGSTSANQLDCLTGHLTIRIGVQMKWNNSTSSVQIYPGRHCRNTHKTGQIILKFPILFLC